MKCILFFFTFFMIQASIAQTTVSKTKHLFFELAGSGGFGSVNYETIFLQKNATALSFRAGLGIAPIDKNNGSGLVFPIMAHANLGKQAHKLELGLGQGITITTKGSFFTLTTASLGYRYQPIDKALFFRITYTPLISYLIDFQVQQWGGISIGYVFRAKKNKVQ